MDILEKTVIGLGVGVLGAIIIFIVTFLTSIITLWAWNTLMPFVFHLPQINFWQAFAFNLLAGQFRSSLSTTKK